MSQEIEELVKAITHRLLQPRPETPKEFAAFIWDLFRLSVTRVVEVANTAKMMHPSMTRDIEIIHKYADLYGRMIGGTAAAGGPPAPTDNLKSIAQAVARGDKDALRKMLEQVPTPP